MSKSFFKNILKNFLIFSFSIFISFIFIEILLSLFFPQPLRGSWLIQDETGLYINKNYGSSKDSNEHTKVIYHFDKFNNRKNNNNNNNNKDKILILGDSYTFGHLIEDGYTYVDKLQNDFKNYELINSAVVGWGTEDYTKFIDNYCLNINPKYIIIFLNSHDIGRAEANRLFEVNNNLLINKKPKLNQVKIFLNNIPYYEIILENSHFASFLRKSLQNIYYNYFNFELRTIDKTLQFNSNKASLENLDKTNELILYKIKQLFIFANKKANLCGAKLIVIDIGTSDYFQTNNAFHIFKNQSKSFFHNNDIIFLDLTEDLNMIFFRENVKNLSFKNDGHPNKIGNDYIYKAASKALKNIIE